MSAHVPKSWLIPLLAALASLLFVALIYLGFLRLEVPAQHWFYHAQFAWGPLLVGPFAALALLAAALRLALAGPVKARVFWVLLAAFLCAYVCAVGTRLSSRMGFTFIAATIISDGSNSYFNTAAETDDALALARDYPARMPHLRLHAATQSPGSMLLHAGLRRLVLNSPAAQALAETLLWVYPCHRTSEVAGILNRLCHLHLTGEDVAAALIIGLIFPLVGALGVLPVFALGRRLAGYRVGLLVTALYAVTPSLVWFTAAIDQVYPTLAVLTMLLLYVAALSPRSGAGPAFAAGLLTGLGIFLNFGFSLAAAIGALFLMMVTCLRNWPARRRLVNLPFGRVLFRVALYAAGATVILALAQFVFGIHLIGSARVSGMLRDRLYLQQLPRPWLTWFLLNPVEFTIGLGFSSAAVVIAALVLWRRARGGSLFLLLATLAVLLLLNLSGAARAEWSRMLLFVMPLCLLGAASAIRKLKLTQSGPALLLVLAQGLCALVSYQLFDVWGFWVWPFR